MPAKAPKTLKAKHQMIALLVATGQLTNRQIAKKLRISANRISTIKNSPLFAAMVRDFQSQIAKRGMDKAIDMIMADAPKNIEFIRDVRDGMFEGDEEGHLRIRMSAATFLGDRQVSKKSESSVTTTSTHTYLVEDRRRAQLENDAKEIGRPMSDSVDAEFEEVPVERLALPAPEKPFVRTLDEAIDDYADLDES